MYKAWDYRCADIKLVWGPPGMQLFFVSHSPGISLLLCDSATLSQVLASSQASSTSVLALLAHTCLCKPFGCKGLPFGLLPWRFRTCMLPCRLGCAMLLCRLCRPLYPAAIPESLRSMSVQHSSHICQCQRIGPAGHWPRRGLLPCSFSRMHCADLS